MKTKMDLVRQLRRVSDETHLEMVVSHMEQKMEKEQTYVLHEAADHRRAELAVGKIFDKVPKEVWKYVR
ncbi:TPA: Hha/YmoA family nucleoid-associated regulatory protein [Klebsiella aerogenes]